MFSNKLFKVSPIPTFLWEAIEKLQKLAPLVLGIDDDPEFSFLIRENIFFSKASCLLEPHSSNSSFKRLTSSH